MHQQNGMNASSAIIVSSSSTFLYYDNNSLNFDQYMLYSTLIWKSCNEDAITQDVNK